MVYEIRASTRVAKSFDKVVNQLSEKSKKRLFKTLTNIPKSCRKKQKFWCYEDLPNANRILFTVNDKSKIVQIVTAGDHNEQMKFLRSKR